MIQGYFLSKNTLKHNNYHQQYIIHKIQLYYQYFQEYHEYDMPLLDAVIIVCLTEASLVRNIPNSYISIFYSLKLIYIIIFNKCNANVICTIIWTCPYHWPSKSITKWIIINNDYVYWNTITKSPSIWLSDCSIFISYRSVSLL